MRLAAAELVESREILPGQWLQAYHAPDLANGSRAGQFVHVRTGDFSGLVLRRPFSINTADAGDGHRHDPFPGHRPRDRVVHAAAPRRRDRPARAARPAVRGRPAQPAPAADRGRSRHGRRPDARRRGDPRRPPGDAAVRRGERARGLPVEPAARRGRVRRRHGRRLARPPRLRDRPRARVRGAGPTRPSPAGRAAMLGRSPSWPRGVGSGSASRSSGGSAAAAGPTRSVRRRRGARRSCRCRWSRTWAAPSARASAASS